ncbi:MAG: uracil-DNA glycosylase [Gemmatimonadota bacterium]
MRTDGSRLDPTELARLLRQRQELGAGPVLFERFSRDEILEAARSRRGESNDPEVTGLPKHVEAPSPFRPTKAGEDAGADGEPSTLRNAGKPNPASLESLPAVHDELREVALGCTRCGLAEGRTQVVFADGNPQARVMVVGEAPGANEDRTGLPFVGPAGKLLDLLLASIDLSRKASVYICNVVKCRPPGNRNPRPDEIETCSPFLLRQIAVVKPEAILAVGTFAAQLLTGSQEPLGKLRGSMYSYEGIPLVVTYHPAALLRNSGWVRPTWDDLQLLCRQLDAPTRKTAT